MVEIRLTWFPQAVVIKLPEWHSIAVPPTFSIAALHSFPPTRRASRHKQRIVFKRESSIVPMLDQLRKNTNHCTGNALLGGKARRVADLRDGWNMLRATCGIKKHA